MADPDLSRLAKALHPARRRVLDDEEYRALALSLLEDVLAAAPKIAQAEGARPLVVALTLMYGPDRVTVTDFGVLVSEPQAPTDDRGPGDE